MRPLTPRRSPLPPKPKLIILACLLGTLLAVSGWLLVLSQKVTRTQPFASINALAARRLLIDGPSQKIVLEKKEDAWRLTAPVSDLADPEPVEDIIAGLRGLTVGLEMSRDASSYSDFEITESSATRVRLFAGESAASAVDVYFGKEALGYDSLYMRSARDQAVHLTTGLGSYRLRRSADELRQRRLIILDKDAWQKIRLTGTRTLELLKSSSSWSAAGRSVTHNWEALLNRLAGLRAAEFASGSETPAATGLEKPSLTVEMSSALRAERLIIGKARAEKKGPALYHYARVEGRPAVLIGSADADALIREAR